MLWTNSDPSSPSLLPSLTPSLLPDYVVLEDLTLKFQYPCVLDLKVGTRQHGDDITEEKRKLHVERCAKSTSQTLGVRICGMQVRGAGEGPGTMLPRVRGMGHGVPRVVYV